MRKLKLFFALLLFTVLVKAQNTPQLVVQKGNSSEISCISYSPDGRKILALCPSEGTIKIWETASGRLLNTIASHAIKATYSNNGNYILVEEDGLFNVYDATADTVLYTVESNSHFLPYVLFANEGLWLVTAGLDSFVRIKNTKDGSDIQTIPTRYNKVSQAVLSPDKTHMLIISSDTAISMFNIGNNSTYYELGFAAKTPLQCKFSNTGKYAAVKWCQYYDYDHEHKDPYDIKTVVIETTSGKQIGTYDSVFAFSPDETRMLVSKRPDYIVRANGIYDSISEVSIAGDSVLFRRNMPTTGSIRAASYSGDGNFFVLWSSMSMQVFNSQSHTRILTPEQDSLMGLTSINTSPLTDNIVGLRSLTISADSKNIAVGTDMGKIFEQSIDGSRAKSYEDPFNAIDDARFVPKHSYIFTRSIDNYGIIWNLKDASLKYIQDLSLKSFSENDNESNYLPQFRKVDFNTDGSFFTTTTPVGITLRRTEGLTKVSSMETFGSLSNYLAVSPDAKFICRADREGDTPTKDVTVSAIGSSGHLSKLYTIPFSSFFPVTNTTVFSFPVQETIVPQVEDISFKGSRHIVVRFDGQLDKRSPFKIKTKQMKNGLSLLGIDPCYKDNSSPEITNFHCSYSALLHTYIVCTDNKIYRVSPATGSIEKTSVVLLSNPHLVDNLEFDPQAKYAFYKNEGDKKIYAVEVVSGKAVYSLKGNDNTFSNISFSPNAKSFITLSDDKSIATIWNTATGDSVLSITNGITRFLNAVYSADSQYILFCLENGSYEKREAATGRLIYTFFLFKDYDYAIILPEGYYYSSSRSDVKYLNFRLQNKLYNFSQFDLQFNRPDKVLQALGSTDTELINAYHQVWVKRISESGFRETDFENNSIHVPDVNLLNRSAFPEVTSEKIITLYFSISDSLYNVTGYNIYINDVPLFGIKGSRLQKPANKIRLGQVVSLDLGMNKIEIDCVNEKGQESRKETFYITYQPSQPELSKTWFIGVGINNYSQHKYLPDLKYCVNDIRDLAASFVKKYNYLEIDTLINEDATRQNILALKKVLMQTGVNDRVIISFNGHGMNYQNEFYFSTPSINPQSPEADGISYTDMQNLLDSIPARKKLLLIDACHSGEADADDFSGGIVAKGMTYLKNNTENKLSRGNSSVEIIDVKRDDTGKVFNVYGMMKASFIDLRKNNGAVVIAASQSNQQALEKRDYGNGLFTRCILNQFYNPTLNVSELLLKINEEMKNETQQQQSVSRQELSESDWALW